VPVLLAAALAIASATTQEERVVSRTSEGRRVVLTLRAGAVVHVRAGLQHYRCETFGDIGPVVVAHRGRARVAADGSFRFIAGEPAQRVVITGRLAGRRATGRLRLHGTIATGQRCSSATLRFR
jgi:hypothetical protein